MNSILYGKLFHRTTDPNNVNYNNASFPCGFTIATWIYVCKHILDFNAIIYDYNGI